MAHQPSDGPSTYTHTSILFPSQSVNEIQIEIMQRSQWFEPIMEFVFLPLVQNLFPS